MFLDKIIQNFNFLNLKAQISGQHVASHPIKKRKRKRKAGV
jgi:hypothetical protein